MLAPSEVTLVFVVTVDAVTVNEPEVTIQNTAALTPYSGEKTYDGIPSNTVETGVTIEVKAVKAASVTDMYVGNPEQDRRWVYVFTLTNTNTAPMQVNLVDDFDSNITFYNWVNTLSTDPTVFPHLVSQTAYQDPETGTHSINVTLVLAPATVDQNGNVVPSSTQYAVIVEGKAIILENEESVEISVPNVGQYAASTNITDPIDPADKTLDWKDTNQVTVVVWAESSVLPVTGEWLMLLVPLGGLMTLAGVLMLMLNRRKHQFK